MKRFTSKFRIEANGCHIWTAALDRTRQAGAILLAIGVFGLSLGTSAAMGFASPPSIDAAHGQEDRASKNAAIFFVGLAASGFILWLVAKCRP